MFKIIWRRLVIFLIILPLFPDIRVLIKQRIASPSNLPFFRYGDTELSLLNSRLADVPWGSLVSDSDFNHSFDSFYDLVKEGILKFANRGPALHASKRIAPLNPWMTPGLHKSWKRKKLFVEALQGFIIFSSSRTIQGL